MVNDDPKRKEDVKDIIGIQGWPLEKGRDGERKPMQWNGDTNAGFSTSRTPWLPVAPGYQTLNAAAEAKDPASILNYYKALLRLRKTNPALRGGDFALVNENDPNVLSFVRRAPDHTAALIVLNCTAAAQTIAIRGLAETKASVLLSSFAANDQPVDLNGIHLPPYGALVARIAK
jgi:alpha-glucosidase